MKKDNILLFISLIGSIFFFWIGMSTLLWYKQFYGELAITLWLSGLFTLMGINGSAYMISWIVERIKERRKFALVSNQEEVKK